MSVFGGYARYYNLLYQNKNYAAESRFVHDLIQKYAPQAKSILELGCGTGIHAENLMPYGYSLCGVDLSAEMLALAQTRLKSLPKESQARLKFLEGDLRSLRLPQQFDAVISLFHVFSYQTTALDLDAAFATVKKHLHPQGIFVFDFWYGPAVLTDRPVERSKALEDSETIVTRLAKPEMFPNHNRVDVHYEIKVADRASGKTETIHEKHPMRYLFLPEIEFYLEKYQLKLVQASEWLSNRALDFDTWNGMVAAVHA